ncbi:histone H2B-like [Carcharodon carcharias]|uniref:histone H2B-like n=1 Tax=Carcharodon carcharias TaxID=13397 RepID=UPI001B7E1B1C|nr:histone H2B-like [Carcharodon carcharias]
MVPGIRDSYVEEQEKQGFVSLEQGRLRASRKASKQLLTKVTKKPPKRRRKSHKQSYSTYMCRVLTQVHPPTRFSSKAMSVMSSFAVDIFECITSKASHLIHYNKCHTISAWEIQIAICLMLPGKLDKHGVSEGTKAVTKYTNSILAIHSKDYGPDIYNPAANYELQAPLSNLS